MEPAGRKIVKRSKFGPKNPHVCPADAPVSGSHVTPDHPISGSDPGTCYLDVIPEARALYRSCRTKRKSTDHGIPNPSEDKSDHWKRYREMTRTMSSSSVSSSDPISDGASSTSGSEGEKGREGAPPRKDYQPVRTAPRKRRWRAPTYKNTIHQIDEILKDFRLTDDTYRDIMELLDEEMRKGLARDTHDTSTVRMFPTYVRSTPDGTEHGRYIALDLGGTNFRVLLVDLKGTETPEIRSKLFLIPMRIMLGSGTALFDHIASCIREFMEQEGLLGQRLPLGFTFSFPCYQDGLDSARLVRWTKGFKCAGVEGNDVVRMLHEAIERRGDLDVECCAIINDPVGALMAGAHADINCRVGLILGTGTNCCYMENLDKVELWDGDKGHPNQVIVNTEWGAFGDNGVLEFLRNDFDKELDGNSLNPGHQLFEKMISGMYMGELIRLVLCELTEQQLLFGGEGSEMLFTPQRFLTKYISEIESDDPEGQFFNTKLVLQEMDIPNFTINDCRHVQHACWQISQRAAYLAATAVATVIDRLDRPDVTVAVDGSLYRFHPHFKDLMNKKIAQLIKPHQKFKLALAHDGSGQGAALVVAVAKRTKEALEINMDTNEALTKCDQTDSGISMTSNTSFLRTESSVSMASVSSLEHEPLLPE